jgi:hypothetical protein
MKIEIRQFGMVLSVTLAENRSVRVWDDVSPGAVETTFTKLPYKELARLGPGIHEAPIGLPTDK